MAEQMTLDERNLELKWKQNYKIYVVLDHTWTGDKTELWVGKDLGLDGPPTSQLIMETFLADRGWEQWKLGPDMSLPYWGPKDNSVVYNEANTWDQIWHWLINNYDFRRIEEYEEIA